MIRKLGAGLCDYPQKRLSLILIQDELSELRKDVEVSCGMNRPG
ncbi:hypothetical protein [Cystobacter fuscus]|nr:hypothetical protein [Cystobacter fuscus]